MKGSEMVADRPPKPKSRQRGQGLLELVVILPVLLILMVGVAEIGVGLRTYLLVMNANREAARFAARGRYDDNRVAERVISAGGVVELGGTAVPFLRPSGTEPNTGIIVTHVEMDPTGTELTRTVYYTGVVPGPGGGVVALTEDDTRLEIGGLLDRQSDVQAEVGALRESESYEPVNNHLAAVEVYFAHEPLLLSSLVPIPDPWPMYARTVMRVTQGR